MESLAKRLEQPQILLMDGAMGTELLKAVGPEQQCLESLNLTRPRLVLDVHRAYQQAGAQLFLTNTFQANPLALARCGLEDQLEPICKAGLHLARMAAGKNVPVLAALGPIQQTPGKSPEFMDREAFQIVLEALQSADGFLLETCSSPESLRAVQYAIQRFEGIDDKPILLSLSYLRNSLGNLVTQSGHGPETYARHAIRHGVSALGVNCGAGIGISDCAEILARYRQETDLPLFARPNAGVAPHLNSPQEMAKTIGSILDSGAIWIGGCCGTTPDHIRVFASSIHSFTKKNGIQSSGDRE